MPDHALESTSLQRYSRIMQDYFDQKSIPSSPTQSPNKAASMWYSAPASLSDHDPDIINVFLNLFCRNVSKVFKLFRDVELTTSARPEYVLAMAAVGGLYCTTKGSFDFSKSMYNDSRRLLFASVRSPVCHGRASINSCQDQVSRLERYQEAGLSERLFHCADGRGESSVSTLCIADPNIS